MVGQLYTQVRLTRMNNVMTCWIPRKFARKSRVLKLKENDIWKDGG